MAILRSILRQAFGARMNSPWSAWANSSLNPAEIEALARAGVTVDPNAHAVTITATTGEHTP